MTYLWCCDAVMVSVFHFGSHLVSGQTKTTLFDAIFSSLANCFESVFDEATRA